MSGIFNNVYNENERPDYGYEGHPVKVPSAATLGTTSLAERKIKSNKSIILPTVLKVTSEEIDYWTNMTCFYDKYWEFEPNFATVPISFMHITSVTEMITAQGAEKRVIVYEAPDTLQGKAGFVDAGISSHPAYKNNLEVIMDNVVVQPKQYQMEVIIPESLIGPFHKQGLARLEALLYHMEQTNVDSGVVSSIANILRGVQVVVGAVEKTASLADLILGVAGGSSQMSTINKNSIEAMVKKGRVVLFKKWTGYDYSYGIITKMDVADKPTEDGVFRGSITFQETPILNISQKKISPLASLSTARSTATSIARYVNLTLAYPFIQFTGVMEEAGAPGSDTADGGGAFDIITKG